MWVRVCLCVSDINSGTQVALTTMAGLWNSEVTPLAAPGHQMSGSQVGLPFILAHHRAISTWWWRGFTDICGLHPGSEGGLILPEAGYGGGERESKVT